MAISKKDEDEKDAYSQPASTMSCIEIHNAAAVGQMQKPVADQIIEAFKTDQVTRNAFSRRCACSFHEQPTTRVRALDVMLATCQRW